MLINFQRNPLVFHEGKRTPEMPSRRTVAAEIEVSSATNQNSTSAPARFDETIERWSASVVEDGSLEEDGFEIRMAPASGEKFVAQVREIGAALAGVDADVSQKAGLHVHVGAYDFQWSHHLNLAWLWAHVEDAAFSIMPRSRRVNTYCAPRAGNIQHYAGEPRELSSADRKTIFTAMIAGTSHYVGADWEYASRKAYEAEKAKYSRAIANGIPYVRPKWTKYTVPKRTKDGSGSTPGGSRYYALNYQSVFAHGTIEFRLHGGTTNPDKIIPWAAWCASLVDLARKLDAKGVADLIAAHPNETGWDAFLAIAPACHRPYFEARRNLHGGRR